LATNKIVVKTIFLTSQNNTQHKKVPPNTRCARATQNFYNKIRTNEGERNNTIKSLPLKGVIF